jgi:hypothetical protein
MRVFVGGAEVGSLAKSGTLDGNPSADIWIGDNPPSTYAPLRGLLDDVRVYNVALDASGVQAVMNEAPAPGIPWANNFTWDGTGFVIHAAGEVGHYFILQQATDLISPAWLNLSTTPCAQPDLQVPVTGGAPQAIYRLLKN